MPVFYLAIYSTILALFVISIIITIINLIRLSTVSSKISLIESELEKKAQLFDSLKKERQSIPIAPQEPQVSSSYELDMSVNSSQENGQSLNSDTIQIVRNVHGVFERTDQKSMHHGEESIDESQNTSGSDQHSSEGPFQEQNHGYNQHFDPGIEVTRVTENVVSEKVLNEGLSEQQTDNEYNAQQEMISEQNAPVHAVYKPEPNNSSQMYSSMPQGPEDLNSDFLPVDALADNDVLDVVLENQHEESQKIVIKIFSDASKDADFATAWKQLTEIMTSNIQPDIILDFNNVNFLYDKELLYLDKMRTIVESQAGRVMFVNCDHELAAVLSSRPTLSDLIQG